MITTGNTSNNQHHAVM